MSASEKRYFKVFAGKSGGKGGKNYLTVFSLLEKMTRYNEKALLQALESDKLRRQFPVTKNYLYKLVLKSLRSFHADRTIDFQIRELLMNAELLLARDLPLQAEKQVSKAAKLAADYERFEFFPNIGSLRIALRMKMGLDDLDAGASHIEAVFLETDTHFATYRHMEHLRLLSLRLLFLSRKETVIRSSQTRKAYDQVMADPCLQGPLPEKPLKARMFYLQSHFIYHIANSDFEAAFKDVSLMVELMEENQWMIAERPENYVNSLQNQVSISTFVNPLEVTLPFLAKMKSITTRFPKVKFSRSTERRLPLYAYNHEFHLLIKEGKFEEGKQLLPAAEAFLESVKDNEINVNEGFILLSLLMNIVQLHILLGSFKEALRYIGLILDSRKVSGDYELYRDARMLKVIVLFELGEEEMLEYALLSLYRFLQKQESLHAFEKAWIQFVRKSVRREPGTRRTDLFAALRADLNELAEGRSLHGSFDMVAWLDRKIESA